MKLIIVLSLLIIAVSAAEYYAPTSSVNIRTGAGTSNTLLWTATSSEVFIKVGSSGDWFNVKKLGGSNAGRSVWVHSGYVSRVYLSCPTVTGLNMRTGPATSYTRIWQAAQTEAFRVITTQGSWKRVQAVTNTRTGTFAWAHGSYLASCNPSAPTSNNNGGSTPGNTGGNGKNWLSSAGSYTVEKLDRSGRRYFRPFSAAPTKFCLHTIEGRWPSDGDWEVGTRVLDNKGYWPHFILARDYNGKLRIGQYLPMNVAGRALKTGNNDGVVQIEIGAKAGKPFTTHDSEITAATKALYKAISDATGIPNRVDPRVQFRESGAYGYNAPQRLSQSTFRSVTGLVGHQHVYGNTHWDPGAINPQVLLS